MRSVRIWSFFIVSFSCSVFVFSAYAEEKASAAIDAGIFVYDIDMQAILKRKRVSSDTYFKCGHTIKEFTENKANLFKKEIIGAAEGLSLRIASEFGLNLDEAAKRKIGIDEVLTSYSISCETPYQIDQDCTDFFGPARPTRKIEIKGVKARLAASYDGKIILIMPAFDDFALSTLKDTVTLNISSSRSKLANASYTIFKRIYRRIYIGTGR